MMNKTLSAEEKEIKIIKLNDERINLINKLKEQDLISFAKILAMKRIEEIDHELEELTK